MKQTIGVFYRCSTLPLWLMGITHSRSIEGFLRVYKNNFITLNIQLYIRTYIMTLVQCSSESSELYLLIIQSCKVFQVCKCTIYGQSRGLQHCLSSLSFRSPCSFRVRSLWSICKPDTISSKRTSGPSPSFNVSSHMFIT